MNVAVAAPYLQAGIGRLETGICEIRLHDRRHQRQQVGRGLAILGVGRMGFDVELQAHPETQRARAFGECLDRQQVLADIGMHDDRVSGRRRRFVPGQATALQTVFSVDQGVLIGDLG